MDYFDKKINDIYNQIDQDVPNGLDWDMMEDGIYERMENKKSNRKGFWIWSSGIVLIALISASLIYITSDKNQTNANLKTPTTNKKIAQENTVTQKLETPYITKNEVENIKTKAEHSTPLQVNKRETNTPTTSLQPSELNSINTLEEDLHEIVSPTNSNKVLEEQMLPLLSYKNIDTRSKEDKNPNTNSINIQLVNSIKTQLLVHERNPIINHNTIINSVDKDVANKEKQRTKYSLSLLGGTTLNSGYHIKEGGTQYHSSLPGYNIRLGIIAQNENGWGYRFGLGHQLLVEKFDFYLEDTVSIVRNEIVQRLTNRINGHVTHNHADVDVLKHRTRRELSFNTISTISFDAAILKSIELGNRWSISLAIGLQYSRILNVIGKTLDNDGEIIAYDSNTSFINKNLISGTLGIGIDYKLSNRLSLSTDINQTLSFNQLSTDGSSLGICYIRGGIIYHW